MRRTPHWRFALVALLSGCAGGLVHVDAPGYSLSFPDHWKLKHLSAGDGDPTTLVVRSDPRIDYQSLLYWPLSGQSADAEAEPEYEAGLGDRILATISGGDEAVLQQDTTADRGSAIRYALMQVDDLSEVEVRIVTWPVPKDMDGKDASQVVFDLLTNTPDLGVENQKPLRDGERSCGMGVPKFSLLGRQVAPIEAERAPVWRVLVLGTVHGQRLVGLAGRVPYVSDEGLYCINLAHMRIELQNIADWIAMESTSAMRDRTRLGLYRTLAN